MDELDLLGEQLCKLAKNDFILGILHRGSYRERSSKASKLLHNKNTTSRNWKHRGVSEEIFSDIHLGDDDVHLSKSKISGVETIMKKRVLYKNYSNNCIEEGHLDYFEYPFKN